MNVLITGGTKGIGLGIAESFAAQGADLTLNYAHDEDSAKQAAQRLGELGAGVDLVQADLTSDAGIDALHRAVDGARIDHFVHCAVQPVSSPSIDVDRQTMDRAVRINGLSLLYVAQGLLPSFADEGSITFLSSIGARRVVPNYAAIGAPKALAEMLVRYLAIELAPRGIRVNTVTCGPMWTDSFLAAVPNAEERYQAVADSMPRGGPLAFEDVAAAVRFLASPEANMITGQRLEVDGGMYVRV